MLKNIFFACFVVCYSASVSWGSIVLTFNLTGQPGDQASTAASFTNANATSVNLSRGSGVTSSAAGDSISSSGWTTGSSVDLNDYYGFSIKANSGYTATINNLSFAERRSGTGIRNFEVRSSTDNFATFTSQSSFFVPGDTTDTRQHSITLTGLSNISSQISFRIYGYGSEAGAGTWRLANNSSTGGVTLDGSFTAVPEPTSLIAAMGMGLCGTWYARRRKKLAKSVTA